MTQWFRFVRLFVFALVPLAITLYTSQSNLTVAGVVPLVVAAAETAWRKANPTVPAPPQLSRPGTK
jgi:hypothetical protein